MGVWIEIDIRVYLYSRRLVTPCMGVWIEILTDFTCHAQSFVTPCMGVWIEITCALLDAVNDTCHSLYGSVD